MHRKDFRLIAGVLYRAKTKDGFKSRSIDALATGFADALKTTNDQFDRERFLRACREGEQ